MNYSCRNKNDPNELYQYAQILYKGIKVRRNKNVAAQYYKAAADKGNLNAMIKYARMLSKGDGIEQNEEESIKYFQMAKDHRYQKAKKYRPIKILYTTEEQIDSEDTQTTKEYEVHTPEEPKINNARLNNVYRTSSPRLPQESIDKATENEDKIQIHNPEPKNPQNQISNNTISDNSNQKSKATNNQYKTTPHQTKSTNTSQLPPIHKKDLKIKNQTIENPSQSQLPPLKKSNKSEQIEQNITTMTRLPQDYIPTHYDLFLHLSEKDQLFEGVVTVTFQKNNDCDSCYLNVSNNIEIKSIVQNGVQLDFYVSNPFLLIFQSKKKKKIDFSAFPVTINYTVKPSLNENRGFFSHKGSYLTCFEPNLARNLLPCFDEPFVRSTFQVTLRIPSNLTGLSNMPVNNIDEYEGEDEITFQTTPPMCTYLLCICIGKFSSIEGKIKSDIPIKIYSLESEEKDHHDIIKVSDYTIDWIESNFKVKYDLPHLQIVFHSSFKKSIGNYGLITCSEHHSHHSSRGLMTVIREIIHQWFGVSVSIKWWDSIWLNEGISSFLQYVIYDDFDKKSCIWNDFIERRSVKSLKYFKNGLISPSEEKVNFDNMFDSMIYEKGSFVMKMFYDIVGRKNFVKVCSNWLRKYKNKSVDIPDFLSLVKNVLNKDYSCFFNPWLKLIGFPTLFVDEIIDENDENKFIGINIKQVSKCNSWFMLMVPILYGKNGAKKKCDLLIDKEITTKFMEFDWLFVNDEIQSLCFVVYSNSLSQKLDALIDKNQLSDHNCYLLNASKKSQSTVSFFRSSV